MHDASGPPVQGPLRWERRRGRWMRLCHRRRRHNPSVLDARAWEGDIRTGVKKSRPTYSNPRKKKKIGSSSSCCACAANADLRSIVSGAPRAWISSAPCVLCTFGRCCTWLVEALQLLLVYQVGQEAGKKIASASEKEREATTHPKQLSVKRLVWQTPGPQAAHVETAEGVGLGPREVCAGPVRKGVSTNCQ